MTRTITVEELGHGAFRHLAIWASPSIEHAVGFGSVVSYPTVPEGSRFIAAVGGGTIIDQAKVAARATGLPLIAVPTLWGSGADASPIAVTSGPDGAKAFRIGEDLRPAFRAPWPALADQASDDQKRWGAADVWSHALEGMTSPLASAEVRIDLASVISLLPSLDVLNGDALSWLDISARACSLQAEASVGLMHGIAHVLEPKLGWGHARVVAASAPLVAPLLFKYSPTWRQMAVEHAFDEAQISSALHALTSDDDVDAVRSAASSYVDEILRDPSTRTSGFLVRKHHLAGDAT